MQSFGIRGAIAMLIRTRVFEMCNKRYRNLTELARAMDLSVSQVYRVREGKRGINEKFIIGAKKAFSECQLDELFYLDPEPDYVSAIRTIVTNQHRCEVQ